MAEFYSYEGIRNGATYILDDTTKTAIAADPMQIVGKVVALTGNYTVGYGASGATPLGFVEMVEKETGNGDTLVVSVVFNQSREGVACAGTETAGAFAACDGTGGIVKSTTATNARIWGVNADSKTATLYIHG